MPIIRSKISSTNNFYKNTINANELDIHAFPVSCRFRA